MFDAQCDLAAIVFDEHERPDDVLLQFCAALKGDGFRPVGLLQQADYDEGRRGAVSAVLVHTDERIELVPDLRGQGCQLDVDQLLVAGSRVVTAVDHGADLVIVNRFGRLECEGKGLTFVIETAISAGLPLIIAVPQSRFADWVKFTEGMSVKLACDLAAIQHWWQSLRRSPSPGPNRPAISSANH